MSLPGNIATAATLPRFDSRQPAGRAISLAIGVCLTLIGATTLLAQAQGNTTEPAVSAAGLEAPLVAPSHGVRAQALVEQWIRRGLPEEPDEQDAIAVTGLLGVQVTLRLDGMTIGRGDAYAREVAQGVAQPSAVDAASLLHQATAQALDAVQHNLHDAHRQALLEQFGDEPPEAPELADVADRLLVDVQLAHRPERIELPRGAELGDILVSFAPGYHGLFSPGPEGRLAAEDTQQAAVIWPATTLATRATPRGQLMRLLDALGQDSQAIRVLGQPDGIALGRFEVVHVVRAQRHLPPRQLIRGNELLPRHIDMRTLDGMIDRLAEHLQRRFTSRDLVRGTYHPTSHRYDPEVAETRDVGLACYALMRYAQHRANKHGISAAAVREAAEAARAAAALLGRTLLEQDELQKPAGLALALLTLVDDLEAGTHSELRDRLADALLAMHVADAGEAGEFQFVDEQGDRGAVTQGTAALITAALAAHFEQTRDPRAGEVAAAQLDALWTQMERRPNVAALPWLTLAHHRAGRLFADTTQASAQLEARAAGFGRMTERLIERQVVDTPVLGPADVIGGFELTASPAAAPPSPDWRTAHVLAYLALTLREPAAIAEHDAIDWVLSGALAARFIGQLTFDETGAYYVRSLPEAVGGVRMAMWDNRLPVSATAMSLLACVQFQETLERYGDDLR